MASCSNIVEVNDKCATYLRISLPKKFLLIKTLLKFPFKVEKSFEAMREKRMTIRGLSLRIEAV